MKYGDKVTCVVCGRKFRMTHELTHSKFVCGSRCRRLRLSPKARRPVRVAVAPEVEFFEPVNFKEVV
jgi:hypothetical protein